MALVERRLAEWDLPCPVEVRVANLLELAYPDWAFAAARFANTSAYLSDASCERRCHPSTDEGCRAGPLSVEGGSPSMPKFIVFFSVAPDTLAHFIEQPEDRRAPVQRAVEAAGGKLEAYYWMFGQYDGLVIVEAPDSATAAVIALTASSSGAFKHFETHELIEADDLVGILQQARTLRPQYRAPGQPG